MQLGKGVSERDVEMLASLLLDDDEKIAFICKCNNFRPSVDRLVVTDRHILGIQTHERAIKYSASLQNIKGTAVTKGWQGPALMVKGADGRHTQFGGLNSADCEAIRAAISAATPGDAANGLGDVVESRSFGGTTVEIYSGGYVRVATFMTARTPFEELRSIEARHIQQDKSSGGRALAAVATMGASTLFSNEHRVAFLTIATDKKVHTLQEKNADRRAFALEAAGNAVLDALRSRITASTLTPETHASAPAPTAADRLRELANLRKEGLLTDEEYVEAKGRLLQEL